jgi:DNA-binding CsgD family transcriptional regulator
MAGGGALPGPWPSARLHLDPLLDGCSASRRGHHPDHGHRTAFSTSVLASGAELIESPDAVRERLRVLSGSARHSIRALQPPSGVGGRRSEDRSQCRWVPTRLVVEGDSAGEYGSLTVRRSSAPLPCQVVIIDAAIAVTAARDISSDGAAMVVREPVLVRTLLCLFEATWADCAPAGPDSPTPIEQNLLELLAMGRTDESIARSLGISVRQVGRRTAHLLRQLGVTSRFAAGAEAVRRGWL